MSTYWGLRCVSHDPPLDSDCWYNHGENQLRLSYLHRESMFALTIDNPDWFEETPAEIYWLSQHRICEILLCNEYGQTEGIYA